jgi:hypothetical protein
MQTLWTMRAGVFACEGFEELFDACKLCENIQDAVIRVKLSIITISSASANRKETRWTFFHARVNTFTQRLILSAPSH